MSNKGGDTGKEHRTMMFDCLTNSRRRYILHTVSEQADSLSERELAITLATNACEESREDVPHADVRSARINLRHTHLPKLDEAGLIQWDEASETVYSTDNQILDDPQFKRLVEANDEWIEVLADKRRRKIISIFESRDESVAIAELARKVAALGTDAEPSAERVDKERIRLHHIHLPKLNQMGLVEYDTDDGTVSYQGPLELLHTEAMEGSVFVSEDSDDGTTPVINP